MKQTNSEIQLNRNAETNAVLHLFEQIKKVQPKDVASLMLLILAWLPGKVWKVFNDQIWVVSEYEYLARDNGYWFYKFIRENHPDITAYYPITKSCMDYEKVHQLGNAIEFASFKHYMLFWAAQKQFTSSKNAGFPSRICEDLVQWNFHRFEYILLNHGITRGKSPVVDPTKTNFDYICTCSDLDKKIIVEDNGQDPEIVVTTGFARHDNLQVGNHTLTNSIIIMPTWRSWLNAKYARNSKQLDEYTKDFLQSQYYLAYMELLNDESFLNWIEEKQIDVYFYLHDNAQYFRKYYSSPSKRVHIEGINSADIQQLLIKGDLLITDYSSVCYDFAYMEKPVIYFQFDRQQFEEYQYKPGKYYSYEKNGLGEICTNCDDLIHKVVDYYKNGCAMKHEYKERVRNYFTHRDNQNCFRIFSRFS